MFLNLLICSTSCAFTHITLGPWNQRTGFLLNNMLLLATGTEFSGPRQTSTKKNPLETYIAQTHVFSITCFAPKISLCQAVECTNTHPKHVLYSPQLQGGSISISGISSASVSIHCKPQKFSFWIHQALRMLFINITPIVNAITTHIRKFINFPNI